MPYRDKETRRAHYKANSEKQKARSEAWRKAHPEQKRASAKVYREANKDKIKVWHKVWRKANLAKHCSYMQTWRKTHPDKNREKSRKYRAKHRALECTSQIEPINEKVVYLRDGWICQHCQKRVDKRFKYPNPMSASLDHIVPLSKGGSHTYDNVQLAHLVCNVSKGDRLLPQGEQMRLC